MRSVWSFWTKPYLEREGVWATPVEHWLSWILSLETAKRHLSDTALYADSYGAELLVDRLGLEFGTVSTALDGLDGEDSGWWALGKLHTYALQREPFVHIDSDVFLWKPLPEALVGAAVFAQHPEDVEYYYNPQSLEDTIGTSSDPWLPEEWKWFRARDEKQFAPCCGIVGGNSVSFLRSYARSAIRIIEERANRAALRSYDKSGNMFLIEQYFLGACLAYHGESIQYLFESWNEATNPFHSARLGYTHLIAGAKRDEWIARRMEFRVQKDYPALFERACTLAASLSPATAQLFCHRTR